jgi:hypothetical protein
MVGEQELAVHKKFKMEVPNDTIYVMADTLEHAKEALELCRGSIPVLSWSEVAELPEENKCICIYGKRGMALHTNA